MLIQIVPNFLYIIPNVDVCVYNTVWARLFVVVIIIILCLLAFADAMPLCVLRFNFLFFIHVFGCCCGTIKTISFLFLSSQTSLSFSLRFFGKHCLSDWNENRFVYITQKCKYGNSYFVPFYFSLSPSFTHFVHNNVCRRMMCFPLYFLRKLKGIVWKLKHNTRTQEGGRKIISLLPKRGKLSLL